MEEGVDQVTLGGERMGGTRGGKGMEEIVDGMAVRREDVKGSGRRRRGGRRGRQRASGRQQLESYT